MVVEARLGRPVIGAKAQHNPDLVGRHRIEPVQQPKDDDGDYGERNPGSGVEIPRQYPPEPILAAAQQLLEIGWLRAAAARAWPTSIAAVAATPRAAAARTGAPWATALTLPEHRPRTFPRRSGRVALADGCDLPGFDAHGARSDRGRVRGCCQVAPPAPNPKYPATLMVHSRRIA